MSQKGHLFVTDKEVDYSYARGWTEWGYLSFSGVHCMFYPTKIYKFHFKADMQSSVGSVSHCRYDRGECLLHDNSHLIWNVNKSESCEYIKFKVSDGKMLDSVWISDSENLALTFTEKRKFLPSLRCLEISSPLEISDQGIAVTRLAEIMVGVNGSGVPPPSLRYKRNYSSIFNELSLDDNWDEKQKTDYHFENKQRRIVKRDQPGVMTSEFAAGQLQFVMQKVKQLLNFAFSHTFLFVCRNAQQISRILKATIIANPTIAFREILNISYITARISGNLVQIYPCQRLSRDQYKILPMKPNECYEDIPIKIYLMGKFLIAFLDPKTNIVKTTSKPIRCDFLNTIPIALGEKYRIYHS